VLQQWLSRHFGYRRYLAGALALFTLGTFAASQVGSPAGLTLARAIQGLGSGALFTSSRVLVQILFAPAQRPTATRFFMIGAFGTGAIAPILSATMVDNWGWQWVFLAAIPLALLAVVGVLVLLPDNAGRGCQPVRWAAGPLLFFAAAVGCVQWALSAARFEVFSHPLRLALAVLIGVALVVAFLMHQWRQEEPLLQLRELRHPVYVTGLGLYFLYYVLVNFSGYLFPIFAERGLGIPLLTAGWLNSAAGLMSLVLALIYMRVGPRFTRKVPLMALGTLGLGLTGWLFAVLPADAPVSALWAGVLLKGMGVFLILPVAGLTFRSLPEDHFAHGYQSKNLMRQLAGSFATAVAAIAMQDRQFALAGDLSARLNTANPWSVQWLDSVQAGFTAHGMASGQAHVAALATLARVVDQQALLMACEDLYRGLGVLALFTLVAVLVQRQLK
jgi:DHA2 family multidrug resistance protein